MFVLLNMRASKSKVYGEYTKRSENLKYIFSKNYCFTCIINSVLLLFQKRNFYANSVTKKKM